MPQFSPSFVDRYNPMMLLNQQTKQAAAAYKDSLTDVQNALSDGLHSYDNPAVEMYNRIVRLRKTKLAFDEINAVYQKAMQIESELAQEERESIASFVEMLR